MAKINPGDSILLATSNDTYQFVDAKPSVKFRIGKQQVKATDLVDASFGQLFTLQNKALVPTTRDALNITLEASNNNKKDNRDLDDDNKAHATWDSKTEFSKAKWLKRKAKKYLPWVQQARAARAPDAVAQLLARGNVRAGARVVVVDACHGVVAGAVAERCGERGTRVVALRGPAGDDGRVKKFNFSDALRGAIATAPADVFYAESSRPEAESLARDAEAAAARRAERTEDARPRATTARPAAPGCARAPTPSCSRRASTRSPCSARRCRAPPELRRRRSRRPPRPPLRARSPGSDSGHAVRVQLTETWQRDFQILENRSHPDMAMTANAGSPSPRSSLIIACRLVGPADGTR
ncbi:tRNA methyltransferase [Aureococcus anophagefferens]|uniref:tRNA (adenine(58)-N(1))-methyltransferase non-catalytic subunit TRM6 n=1 Tax=Aureococcus anophagefferens TaxID=44056 RepID=A0ABR1G7B9_AURAN